MATMNDSALKPLETLTPLTLNPKNQESNSNIRVSSDYEKCREERIKENLERMQKLGIYDLSLKLRSIKPSTRRNNTDIKKTPLRCRSPLPSSVPTRRSSRLQNTPAVSYSENLVSKKGKDDDDDELIRENSKPEVYTEEHEKMLGEAKMEWTLFVDGYGKDGKKIYDQVRGKTCHQCRQKTLGHRTHCIKCNLVQGQFCGDCLYMRYGENVLEAKQNPDWICPVCRGICNCSLCRQAKGWAPTGIMYRKISSLGYKSVAHYLIQTRRSDPKADKNIETVSAKRSLPFSTEEADSESKSATNEEIIKTETQSSDEEPQNNNVKLEIGEEIKDKNEEEPQKNNVKLEIGEEIKDKNEEEPQNNIVKLEIGEEINDKIEVNEVNEDENKNKVKIESEVHLQLTNNECKVNDIDDELKNGTFTPETAAGSQRKRHAAMEPTSGDSIARRLRSRIKCT